MIAPHEKRKPRTAREVGISCTPAVLREVIHSQSRMPIVDASLSVAASGSCSALRGFRPQELYIDRYLKSFARAGLRSRLGPKDAWLAERGFLGSSQVSACGYSR